MGPASVSFMTEIWAHRGASAYAPENTLPAFELAERQGADGVELDVHLSADGELVVIHDETVDRTSDGTGAVSELSLESLRELDFSNGRPGYAGVSIPTLAEVFELVRPSRMLVNVELKTNPNFQPGIESAVVAAVEQAGMADRVLLSSFNHLTLKTVQQIAPHLPVALLFDEIMYLPWEYAREFGAVAINPAYSYLQVNGAVELAHAAGIRINPWTIDNPQHLAWALELGVDAVITNTPDVAVALREQRPGSRSGE